jgi:hypothetical protein
MLEMRVVSCDSTLLQQGGGHSEVEGILNPATDSSIP